MFGMSSCCVDARTSAPFGVGLEVPIVAQLLAAPRSVSKTTAKALISHRRSRRSGVLTCIDPSPMPTEILVSRNRLDLPTPGIQVDQGPRGFVGGAGGQAPRLFMPFARTHRRPDTPGR